MSFASLCLWPIHRSMEVVKDHRQTLAACDNVTGRIVSLWAKVMCLPQFSVALVLGCLGYPASGSFFVARIAAMVVVGEVDKFMPLNRAAGICHLSTFGPLFLGMLWNGQWAWNGAAASSSYLDLANATFVWIEMRVTALCLFLDSRDLIFQLCGYKYPCYIREAVQAKALKVDDAGANHPVTWWNRILGP